MEPVSEYIEVMVNLHEQILLLLNEMHGSLATIEAEPELSIHSLRKRTKYIRALLLLDPKAPQILKTHLKVISHLLAPYRDAVVNLVTYQVFCTVRSISLDPKHESSLRQNPFFQNQQPSQSEIARINRQLNDFDTRLRSTVLELSEEYLLKRIKSSFRTSKKAMRRVKNNPDGPTVHAWRKRTKCLWYQLRYVFGDELEESKHPVVMSDTLGKLLGDIHDLDVLRKTLGIPSEEPLGKQIQAFRQTLLIKVLELGKQLFSQQDTLMVRTLSQLQTREQQG